MKKQDRRTLGGAASQGSDNWLWTCEEWFYSFCTTSKWRNRSVDAIYRKELCRLYLKNYFKTTLTIQNGFNSLDDKQLTMAKNVQAKLIIERSIMQNKTLTRFKCRFSLLSRLTSPSSPTSLSIPSHLSVWVTPSYFQMPFWCYFSLEHFPNYSSNTGFCLWFLQPSHFSLLVT